MQISLKMVGVAGAVALAAAHAAPVLAQSRLSIDDALRLALENQPALSAYTREANAAQQAAVAARQLPDPKLVLGVQNLPVTGSHALSFDADFMTMKTVGIMREQVRDAKRQAASARYLAEAAVSHAEQSLLARRIQSEVMRAWSDVIEAQQKHRLHEVLLKKLEARRAAIEAAVATGGASVADAMTVKAEIAGIRAEHLAAVNAEQAARSMLSRWIGEAAARPLDGTFPLCRPIEKEQALGELDGHPMLELARQRRTVATRSLDIARADRLSDWNWSAMYGQRGESRADMIMVQVTIDLPFNQSRLQNRRIAEATELAAAAQDRAEDTRRELVAGFERSFADWHAAYARYQTTVTQVLPALEAAEQALEARYGGGGTRLESVQLASQRTTEASVRALVERAALARASADLMFYLTECAP